MSCKWAPQPDDYKYDACDEYDLISNDETHNENEIVTLFQPNDSTSDQVKCPPKKTIYAEIGFLLRQTGISPEFKDSKLFSKRTGINLLGDTPFTVAGFPNQQLPADHFKLGDTMKSQPIEKKNDNAADNEDSTIANTTCLVVKLSEGMPLEESEGAVGLCEDFVTTPCEGNSKTNKKKKDKEKLAEASKQNSKNVSSKKSKKTRWTAVQIPEFDKFPSRANLLQSLRPA